MAASKGPEAVAVATLQVEAAGRDSVRGEAMAASKGPEAVAAARLQGEAAGRDSVRGLESRYKGVALVSYEEPEEGRAAAVVAAEAAEEAGLGGEAAPALADEGRAG
jgi:hypothetical protein